MCFYTVVSTYNECCALYGVKPNKDIARQISTANFFTISKIDASRTFLGELGVKALLDFVWCHAGIQRLCLVGNGVDSSCVEHLCGILQHCPALSYIDISENILSTPSARLLWKTASAVQTVREIKIDNCGISEEWMCRLKRCCEVNDKLQRLGFHLYGPERCLWAWEMVLILVIGSAPLVERYCAEVVPFVGSFISRFRLRVASLTIEEGDTEETVKGKVCQCKSSYNYSLSWCVALSDGLERWRELDLIALTEVLLQKEPFVLPLRNKFGESRGPVHRWARHLFVYAVRVAEGPGPTMVPPAEWLPVVGASVPEDVKVPPAVALGGENRWRLRCQTDLCFALRTVFAEPPRPTTLVVEGTRDAEGGEEGENEGGKYEEGRVGFDQQQLWQVIEHDKHLGALHPKCKEVMLHAETPTGAVSVPLVLYGEGVFDQSKLLSCVAAKHSTDESLRVVPYYLSHENRSLIVFLYFLLSVFSKKLRTNYYRSVEELSNAVREAICNYKGIAVLLLIARFDLLLDSLVNQQQFVLEWLPPSLPSSVRVILSLNTASPFLSMLRKRLPQPYEVLIEPLKIETRLELFLNELFSRGVGDMMTVKTAIMANSSLRRSGNACDNSFLPAIAKTLEGPFLQKDGSEHTSFATYTVSLLYRMSVDLTKHDIASVVSNELPGSLDEVLTLLLRRYGALSDPVTVQYLTLSLIAAPLPISELVYICEELGPCPRHKTLPVILMMSDDRLLTVTSDSIVHLLCLDVRRVVLSLYGDMQETLSLLVETHLYRLVNTQSPDMSFCFRHLVSLMIDNGSFDAAYDLVLNPIVVDALLNHSLDNSVYLIDLIFRLLDVRWFLVELGGFFFFALEQMLRRLKRRVLRSILKTVQSHKFFFYQSALLLSDASPYHTRAVEASRVPYTVLVPLNRGDEDCATHTIRCRHMPIHCHLRKDYLVVTTTQEVLVYSTGDFRKEVARYFMPFEPEDAFCGSLLASGTRVVIICGDRLLLWDFAGQSFVLFEDTVASINENALDSFCLNLVVCHPSSRRMSIIDLLKKRVVSDIRAVDGSIREALFSSSGIFALAVYDLFLIREDKELVKFSHNGVINCFTFCNDNSLVASCVKSDILIWSGAGELLHFIGAGLTPMEDICFNASGNLLLSWQSEGLKLWNALGGKRITILEQCFDEEFSFASFTEDDSRIIERCGSHICMWDLFTHRPVGALACGVGYFTFVQERNQIIVGATSNNEVKIWQLRDTPISSVQAVKEKMITTMWRKNGKLSRFPIIRLNVDPDGTRIALVDEDGSLMIQPMSSSTPMFVCGVRRVHSVIFFTDNILFTTCLVSDRFFCLNRMNFDDAATPSEILLPHTARADATLELVGAEDGRSIAVIANCNKTSVIYVYSVSDWTLTSQFLGHYGQIVNAFFFGDFLLTSGNDCSLRLWSLERHAERASYVHDCSVVAATAGHSTTFFFIDNLSQLFHVKVKNISSVTQAHFFVAAVELTVNIPATVRIRQVVLVSELLVMSEEDGSVCLVDLSNGGAVSRLSDYKCLCLAAATVGADNYVLTGHSTGEVILHHVRFFEQM